MSGFPFKDDLTRWLDQATEGLLPEQAAPIRAELTAHFEDAVEAWVEQGMSPQDARQRALADLGDPCTTARSLNDTHRGQQEYKRGMLASLLVLVCVFGFSPLKDILGFADYSTADRLLHILANAVNTVLIVRIVITMRRMIMWRFDVASADFPSRLIMGGFAVNLAGNVLLELIVDTWDPVPTLHNTSSALEALGLIVMHGGILVICAGMLLLAGRVLAVKSGLVKGVAVIGGLQCLMLALAIITLHLDIWLSYPLYELSYLFNLLLWPLLFLLFFQAIFTYRQQPLQIA